MVFKITLGADMILCHCAAVTDTTIERLIQAGADSVEEITRRCGAGRRCAPCRDEIATLLYAADAAHYTGEEDSGAKRAAA